jgi:hypothetical protein
MAEMEVKVEDNTGNVKQQLNKAIEMVLFAWGTEGVAGCVEKASEIDNETGRPTVDTGRYRAGFGFITPTQGKMSGTPAEEKGATDDFSGQRASKDTVIIANNVEYAPYLEYGTGTKEGGHHARNIMRNGIESKIEIMKKDMEQILKGQGTMNISGITGGKG